VLRICLKAGVVGGEFKKPGKNAAPPPLSLSLSDVRKHLKIME